MKKCYLHIGTVKTGTTKLQGFFNRNRDALCEHGFYYSKAMGPANHSTLAAYAQDSNKIDDLRMQRGVKSSEQVSSLRSDIKNMLDEEMKSNKFEKVLFSSEHCSSRLVNEDEVMRLKSLLEPHFAEIEVVLYLRLQDELALSIYSTQIRNGSTEEFRIDRFRNTSQVLNYQLLLDRWEKVFGKQNIKVRIFDRKCFHRQSLVHDFLYTIGLNENEVDRFSDDGKVQNVSYDCASLETLRRLNKYLPKFIEKSINVNRGNLGEVLEKVSVGPIKPMLSKEDSEAILKVFDASNAVVFENYGLLGSYNDIRKNRGGEISTLPYDIEDSEMTQVFARVWAYKERIANNNR